MRAFTVVGGGIAGMMTAWMLYKSNRLKQIFISAKTTPASRVAAGVINPITGIRFAKTWMADTLIPFANSTYSDIENELKIKVLKPVKILRIAESITQVNDWTARAASPSFAPYVNLEDSPDNFANLIVKGKGAFFIKGALKIDVDRLFNSLEIFFSQKNLLTKVSDNIQPDDNNVIFCEGMSAGDERKLPLIPVKGHYLICDIPVLKTEDIIQGSASVIPMPDGSFKVGSTYQHNINNCEPEEEQIELLCQWLGETITTSYKIKNVAVGVRPSTPDRRPLLGCIDQKRNHYIFNGLGTKGYSLAPYFANHLLEHIFENKLLLKEVNISRFL